MIAEFMKNYFKMMTIPFRMNMILANMYLDLYHQKKEKRMRLHCSKCGRPADMLVNTSFIFYPEAICGDCICGEKERINNKWDEGWVKGNGWKTK